MKQEENWIPEVVQRFVYKPLDNASLPYMS